MPPRTPKPAWSNLESRLQEIEQGDLISFGAVGIVTRRGAAFAASAGLERDAAGVVALTVETAAGWYAVLSQDCDIVRGVDTEPTLTVAPVMFIFHQSKSTPHATRDAPGIADGVWLPRLGDKRRKRNPKRRPAANCTRPGTMPCSRVIH